MKLQIDCPECSQMGKHSVVQVEPTNEGQFEATCAAGHRFKISVGYHDFQILFEIGINAIHDGYYREAIGSFAASYERFHEFFSRIVVTSSGTDAEEFKKAWKDLSKQSERQLGAFISAFLMTYREAPVLLPQKLVEFRNDVIHKGKIPTRDKCIEYGENVMKIILGVLRRLWRSHQWELIGSINTKMFPDDDKKITNFSLPWMILSTNREPPIEGEERGLESLLEGIAKVRERYAPKPI